MQVFECQEHIGVPHGFFYLGKGENALPGKALTNRFIVRIILEDSVSAAILLQLYAGLFPQPDSLLLLFRGNVMTIQTDDQWNTTFTG